MLFRRGSAAIPLANGESWRGPSFAAGATRFAFAANDEPSYVRRPTRRIANAATHHTIAGGAFELRALTASFLAHGQVNTGDILFIAKASFEVQRS